MGKGDHPRSWAHSVGKQAFAEKYEGVDWSAGPEVYAEQSVRVCMTCKAPKPTGRWCETCQAHTDAERIYVSEQS